MSHDANIQAAATIVAAFVNQKQSYSFMDLPMMLEETYKVCRDLESKPKPYQIEKGSTVFREYLVCVIDGKCVKNLGVHIKRHYPQFKTFQDYLSAYDLPPNHPKVAPEYSKRRSEIAFATKLGHKK